MRRLAHGLFLVLLASAVAHAATPDRDRGISMHMLPKSVANLARAQWGLTVRPSPELTADAKSTTLQTPQQFLDFVEKQKDSVIENGVWIVTTDPDAYSQPEKNFLNSVVKLCVERKITLFIVRASQLPNGWKRYDQSGPDAHFF